MINKGLCNDTQNTKKKNAMFNGEEDGMSPLSKKDKAKRPKLISPKRQKFETQFEKFMV